jgi:hypothetical protein
LLLTLKLVRGRLLFFGRLTLAFIRASNSLWKSPPPPPPLDAVGAAAAALGASLGASRVGELLSTVSDLAKACFFNAICSAKLKPPPPPPLGAEGGGGGGGGPKNVLIIGKEKHASHLPPPPEGAEGAEGAEGGVGAEGALGGGGGGGGGGPTKIRIRLFDLETLQ